MIQKSIVIILFFLCLLPAGVNAYEDKGKRDPFWPLISASGTIINYGEDITPSDMVLEGIMSDGGGKYTAIINGNIVKPGDTVGSFTIERIEPNVVYFEKGTEKFELNLKNNGGE
jgi:hypothetical protein